MRLIEGAAAKVEEHSRKSEILRSRCRRKEGYSRTFGTRGSEAFHKKGAREGLSTRTSKPNAVEVFQKKSDRGPSVPLVGWRPKGGLEEKRRLWEKV